MLRRILRKYNVRMWTGFIWLRIRSNSGACKCDNKPSTSIQDGNRFVQLRNYYFSRTMLLGVSHMHKPNENHDILCQLFKPYNVYNSTTLNWNSVMHQRLLLCTENKLEKDKGNVIKYSKRYLETRKMGNINTILKFKTISKHLYCGNRREGTSVSIRHPIT